MRTLYIATILVPALLGGSAAHAKAIRDASIGSEARMKIEDCGTDRCVTIALDKQKIAATKSDISTATEDVGVGNVYPSTKSLAKERSKNLAIADRPKPAGIAPTADRSTRRDDQPGDRKEERPSPTTTAKDPVAQNLTVTAPPTAPVVPRSRSPIGEWIPKGGEGRVSIRSCGQALCGYASGANPNDTDRQNPDASKRNRPINGLPVLIDMKPAKNDHWEGQAYDPTDGKTYSSTISLKNTDVLRVEGCVFGGLFCAGENWTRAPQRQP